MKQPVRRKLYSSRARRCLRPLPETLKPFSDDLTRSWPISQQRIAAIFFLVTVTFGFAQAYACRYQLTPDGMDYLDIARQIAERHWSAVANGYWGTLYSVLLSPLFLFRVSPQLELPLAHLFGVVMLVIGFGCFRIFLNACLNTLSELTAAAHDQAHTPLPEPALAILGYALFLWSALILVPVKEIGPDSLVSAVMYLAGAMLLRLQPNADWLNFAAFGLILGVGYWAKAIMFPIGIIFLAISILRVRQWRRCLISTLAFVVVAAPLLAALSIARGRFTFGDSGVLNYATFVSPGGRVIHWQGLPDGSGTPKHATRTLGVSPVIYEFNGPIGGTYPPSYDPAYWNEGHKSTFDLRAQVSVVAGHVPPLIELLFIAQPSLVAAFLFFLLWNPKGFPGSIAKWWQLLAVACAMTGLYMLVHLETRFIGACVVFAWFSSFCALQIPRDLASRRIATVAVVSAVAAILLSLASHAAKTWLYGCSDSARTHVEVAQKLNLPEGTPVAVIGAGNFSYWAHLARLRIVAEIMQIDEADFWRLAPPEQEKFFLAFRSTGALWLIAQPPSVLITQLGDAWEPIGATSYYRHSLTGPTQERTSATRPLRTTETH